MLKMSENSVSLGMSYPTTLKQDVIRYCETHTVKEARKAFDLYDNTIQKWLSNKESILAQREIEIVRTEPRRTPEERLAILTKRREAKPKRPKVRPITERIFHAAAQRNRERCVGQGYPCNVTPWNLLCLGWKQRMRCAISGVELTNENLSIDHIIPLSKGGKDEASNVQLVDKVVNMAKRDILLGDFIALCKAVAERHK